MSKQITRFDGQYRWLSNFWPAEVEFEGVLYPSSEHAYQAAKTLDLEERQLFLGAVTAGQAKRLGRRITIRKDWEAVKLEVMAAILYDKFTRHPELKQKLLDTGGAELIEGNSWGDRFWGVDGSGQNQLGKVLMALREALEPPAWAQCSHCGKLIREGDKHARAPEGARVKCFIIARLR